MIVEQVGELVNSESWGNGELRGREMLRVEKGRVERLGDLRELES